MPNYTFVQDDYKHYDPLQFQMLREIGQKMTDQYNTTMAAYGEMSSKADLFEKLANDVKGKDSVAYQNYMNYANAIRQHTDLLATQGLTPSTMRNLVQAKNDYNRIIAPIEEAYNAREAEAKRQAEYMSKYPGAIFERDANKMGIDQWMKNPSYRAKSLDRETVANRAKERFAALQKKIQEFVSEHGHVDPSTMDANQLKQWVKTNIPYEYQALEKYGVSPDDVRELMLGNPRMQNSILQAIVNDTMGMYGVDTWNTDYDHYTDAQNQQNRFNIYNQVYNSIRGEAPNSVSQDKYDKEVDKYTPEFAMLRMKLKHNADENEKDRAFKKAMAKAAGQKDPDNPYTYYNHTGSINVNTDAETTEVNNLMNVIKLAEQDKEFANYDADDITSAAKKAFGNDWSQMITLPGASAEILKTLKQDYDYASAGVTKEGGVRTSTRTVRVIENASTYSDVNPKFANQSKVNEIVRKIENAEKKGGTISYGSIDLSGYTDEELLAAAKKMKTGGEHHYDPSGMTSTIEGYKKGVNAIGFEIQNRIQKDKWNNGVSPTEYRLRKKVGYDPNKLYSLEAQANQYIGNSALSLKGYTSNYMGASAKTANEAILSRAQAQQARKNGSGENMGSGIKDEDGKYIDMNDTDVIEALTGSKDITNSKKSLNLETTPVLDRKKNKITYQRYFVGNDGKKYFVDNSLLYDGKNERQTYYDAMEQLANKIYNSNPSNTSLNGESMSREKLDKLVNDEINKLPESDRSKITKKEREKMADDILDIWMTMALDPYNKSLEENASNVYLNWYDNTHDVNYNREINNTYYDDPAVNRYMYWMNQPRTNHTIE